MSDQEELEFEAEYERQIEALEAERLSWTQYICERCWISRKFEATEDGGYLIPRPVQVKDPEPGVCAYCGFPTIWGVFVRDNPANVRYPRKKERDADS